VDPVAAPVRPAAVQHAGANPGSERDHEQARGAAAGSAGVLADSRGDGVVVDDAGGTHERGERTANVKVAESRERFVVADDSAGVDRPAGADPGGADGARPGYGTDVAGQVADR
jgi:hypothetical protein